MIEGSSSEFPSSVLVKKAQLELTHPGVNGILAYLCLMYTSVPTLYLASFPELLSARDSIPGPASKCDKVPILIVKAMHRMLNPFLRANPNGTAEIMLTFWRFSLNLRRKSINIEKKEKVSTILSVLIQLSKRKLALCYLRVTTIVSVLIQLSKRKLALFFVRVSAIASCGQLFAPASTTLGKHPLALPAGWNSQPHGFQQSAQAATKPKAALHSRTTAQKPENRNPIAAPESGPISRDMKE